MVNSSNSGACPGSLHPEGANHPCNAYRSCLGTDVADELLDYLWQVAVSLDPRRLFDDLGHWG